MELLARGLSVRDIEDAFNDESGRLLLSKMAVSDICERLWADYQDFATRDLGEDEIAYLFIDGIAERIRPGHWREPVLAAWGFTTSGGKVLLHLMAGSKEDAETVSAFFQGIRGRRLGDPLLVVCDGAAGIIKAIETCFPRSERQRCLVHRMRNLVAKVPEDHWPEFKARAIAAYRPLHGPLPAISLQGWLRTTRPSCRARWPASWTTSRPASRTCGCRSPTAARSGRPTFSSACSSRSARRLKIIPNAFGEKPVLKLMFGAMIR